MFREEHCMTCFQKFSYTGLMFAAGLALAPAVSISGAQASDAKLVAGCENVPMVPQNAGEGSVARCEPGAPAAKPLAAATTIKIATNFGRAEFIAPIQIAIAKGEFAKENITIEMINLPYRDAAPQLATGAVDVAIGGLDAAFFSAGAQKLGVKAVTAVHQSPHAGDLTIPQAGLWCRKDAFSDPANPDFAETVKMSWGSSVGKGSVGIVQAVIQLRDRFPDVDFSKVDVRTIPTNDQPMAMENKALDCAYVLDPVWLTLDTEKFVMVTTQLKGVVASQISFGPSLIEKNPDAGVAFVRALIRTINTYVAGDYHKDAEVMAIIADYTKQSVEQLSKIDSLVFNWQLSQGASEVYQQAYIDLGVITAYSTPLPESDLIDRSFYDRAVTEN